MGGVAQFWEEVPRRGKASSWLQAEGRCRLDAMRVLGADVFRANARPIAGEFGDMKIVSRGATQRTSVRPFMASRSPNEVSVREELWSDW